MTAKTMFLLRTGAAAALGALLIGAPGAHAFLAKTNRGGACNVRPLTRILKGDRVRYGVRVPSCRTRNGVRAVASLGLAVQGMQTVSVLPQKVGTPPYSNVRTSPRTIPGTSAAPSLSPPLSLPIIDRLPILGNGGAAAARRTYTQLEYSLTLRADKGRQGKSKPEHWLAQPGCAVGTTHHSGDTLVCRSFAITGSGRTPAG